MKLIRIINERINPISSVFREVGVSKILEFEEKVDEQFQALRGFSLKVGHPGWASLYSFLTGLVSYKLTMRGEEWWRCFSRMLPEIIERSPPGNVRDAVEHVKVFLDSCRGAAFQREQKKQRLDRVLKSSGVLEELVFNTESLLFKRAKLLVESVSSSLGQDPGSKTVVFALKMAYYAFRGFTGIAKPLPSTIPIPVDVRVSCVSYSSGIVDVVRGDPVKTILSSPEEARRAWDIVSLRSGVPPLHIDSIVWVVGSFPATSNVGDARKRATNLFLSVLGPDVSFRLANELIVRTCKPR